MLPDQEDNEAEAGITFAALSGSRDGVVSNHWKPTSVPLSPLARCNRERPLIMAVLGQGRGGSWGRAFYRLGYHPGGC